MKTLKVLAMAAVACALFVGCAEKGVDPPPPPPPTTHTLTTVANPAVGGEVSVNGTVSAGATTHNAGAQVMATATPKAGYTFIGWSGASTSASASVTIAVNSDLTLTANFQEEEVQPPPPPPPPSAHTLTTSVIPSSTGTVSPASGSYDAGTQISLTATPESGYEFSYWTGSASGSANPITVIMGSNMSIAAVFTPIGEPPPPPPTAYTVTFNSNGGSSVPAQTVTQGGYVAQPTNPTRSGYTFGGWYSNTGLTTAWNFTTDLVNADTTLYAKWTETQVTPPSAYLLTTSVIPSSTGTVSPASGSYDAGAQISLTATPESGYEFSYWTGSASGSANPITVIMGSNMSITAVFTPIGEPPPPPPTAYTVTFNSNGGSSVPAQTVTQGGNAAQPANPTRSGYTFGGWYSNTGLTTAWNFTTDVVNANTTLYAKWTETQVTPPNTTYILTVSRNNASYGTFTPTASQSGVAGTTVNISATANSGYAFVNWTITSGTATIADPNSASTTVTLDSSNATVTANFGQRYTLYVNASYGTVSRSSLSGIAGAVISISATANSGYAFVNWTITSGTATIADPNSASTTVTLDSSNVTITANFERHYTLTATVTPSRGCTVSPESQSGAGGTTFSVSVTAVGSGYRFKNWSVTSGVATITDPNSMTTTVTLGLSNTTVTANFAHEPWEYIGGSVTIGTQTWMDKNLDYETADSWCYGGSPDSCAKYGRLYTWNAARIACPIGWHLPTSEEWDTLVNYAGGNRIAGKRLKTIIGWGSSAGNNGTDEYRFSALPGGSCDSDGNFKSVGLRGNWWSASQDYSNLSNYPYPVSRYMHSSSDLVNNDLNGTANGFSVRCVKDR